MTAGMELAPTDSGPLKEATVTTCPSSRLKKPCATACLQAVLLLLGMSTACKQAVAHTVDDLTVLQEAAADGTLGLMPSISPGSTVGKCQKCIPGHQSRIAFHPAGVFVDPRAVRSLPLDEFRQ